jgi:hypothetical protein
MHTYTSYGDAEAVRNSPGRRRRRGCQHAAWHPLQLRYTNYTKDDGAGAAGVQPGTLSNLATIDGAKHNNTGAANV